MNHLYLFKKCSVKAIRCGVLTLFYASSQMKSFFCCCCFFLDLILDYSNKTAFFSSKKLRNYLPPTLCSSLKKVWKKYFERFIFGKFFSPEKKKKKKCERHAHKNCYYYFNFFSIFTWSYLENYLELWKTNCIFGISLLFSIKL